LIVALLLMGTPVGTIDAPPVVPAPPATGDQAAIAQTVPVVPAIGVQPPPVPTPPQTAAPPPIELPPNAAKDPGDIVVTAQPRVPGDPLQDVNAATFAATQAVDDAVVRPAARAYRGIVPKPVRSGIRNFLVNLTEPVIFLNFLLQLKPGKAAETASRFAINTTIGAAGVLDIAKRRPFKLPYRPNGFAYTMGYYGVKTGAFLYLPLIGPTTVRDVIGLTLDRLAVPLAVGSPFNQPAYSLPTSTLISLDRRAEFDSKLQAEKKDDTLSYSASREDYLKNRQAEIDVLRGKRPDSAPPKPETTTPPTP
jgi:phospholipid-binding lipoprotein MlaA